MKFLITATEAKINEMCDDLDKEIEISKKAQSTGRFKTASRLVERVIKMPIMLLLSYKRINKQKIILTVTTSADGFMKLDVIGRMIKKRARQYGADVGVEVVK